MKRLLCIGHCCHDRVKEGFSLGGTVSYVSFMAAKLGVQVSVATSFGENFLFREDFKAFGIPLHNLSSIETTTFHNTYKGSQRMQVLEARASDLDHAFLSTLGKQWDMVLFAPIANEVDFTVSELFPNIFKIATIQGALRTWDNKGLIAFQAMDWEKLKGIDLLILSEEDINYDYEYVNDMLHCVEHIVVTKAEAGCTVWYNGIKTEFPSFPVEKAVDFTGAGDVFALSYAIAFHSSHSYNFAARFANCAASISIEGKGLESLPSLSKIKERMFLS